MNYRLKEENRLSGCKATIYSIFLDDEQITLFERFLRKYYNSFKSEIDDFVSRLNTMGHDTGAKDIYFKDKEGNLGDGVCILKYARGRKLRLYCIRYDDEIIILGGGGPKYVRALQEDPNLTEENKIMRKVSFDIMKRMKERRIKYTKDWMEFEGDLVFNDEDE